MNTVKTFYEKFDFATMITEPPAPIKEFIDADNDFIERRIRPCAQLLEVGCGYGRLLEQLRKKATVVFGIDFSKTMIAKSRERFAGLPVVIHEMDAQQMSYPNDSFDSAVCLNSTLGNMPGIEQAVLQEMARVAKPGSQVVVSVFSEAARDAQFSNYRRLGLQGIREDGKAFRTDEGFYSRRFSLGDLEFLFGVADLEPRIERHSSIGYVAYATKP